MHENLINKYAEHGNYTFITQNLKTIEIRNDILLFVRVLELWVKHNYMGGIFAWVAIYTENQMLNICGGKIFPQY